MKRANSLEEERQALLEQIHSSRAAYRRMLAQYDEPEESQSGSAAYGADLRVQPAKPHVSGMPSAFPRSMTMRWIVEHPYALAAAAAGVVAVLAIGPRRIGRSVQSMPGVAAVRSRMARPAATTRVAPSWQPLHERDVVVQNRPSAAGAALMSAIGLAASVMRDPARMRMAVRTAQTALEWLRNRRQASPAGGRGFNWRRMTGR